MNAAVDLNNKTTNLKNKNTQGTFLKLLQLPLYVIKRKKKIEKKKSLYNNITQVLVAYFFNR